MIGRVWRAVAGVALVLALAGCATFPDAGPRDWREKVEGAGELGGPPLVPEPGPSGEPQGSPQDSDPSATAEPVGCNDPDLQVVATCLAPVSAVAVLPDSRTALVAERTTGRVLRVQRGTDPVLVTTVPVDPSGGGGLTGLVLSPGYAEDRLVYAYATTPTDNRVLRLAPGEEPKPVLTGIPRGAATTGVRWPPTAATRCSWPPARRVCRRTTARSPASCCGSTRSAGPPRTTRTRRRRSSAPACAPRVGCARTAARSGSPTTPAPGTCSTGRSRARSGIRPGPGRTGPASRDAWHSPGCCWWRRRRARSVFVLRPDDNGTFTGAPESLLQNRYGRLSAAATAPDGLLWLGTTNKGSGGKIVPSDDRVIRIQPPAGGGESRQ